MDIIDGEEYSLVASQRDDNDKSAVACVEHLSQLVISMIAVSLKALLLGNELLTSVASIAASSHPGLLVMRHRTHNRSPTVRYDKMSSVNTETQRMCPSMYNSAEALLGIFAYRD
jgi:hypothetical protein